MKSIGREKMESETLKRSDYSDDVLRTKMIYHTGYNHYVHSSLVGDIESYLKRKLFSILPYHIARCIPTLHDMIRIHLGMQGCDINKGLKKNIYYYLMCFCISYRKNEAKYCDYLWAVRCFIQLEFEDEFSYVFESLAIDVAYVMTDSTENGCNDEDITTFRAELKRCMEMVYNKIPSSYDEIHVHRNPPSNFDMKCRNELSEDDERDSDEEYFNIHNDYYLCPDFSVERKKDKRSWDLLRPSITTHPVSFTAPSPFALSFVPAVIPPVPLVDSDEDTPSIAEQSRVLASLRHRGPEFNDFDDRPIMELKGNPFQSRKEE